MRKILFGDTETTGLPIEWNAPVTDIYNWPRIIEFGWELAWEDGTTIRKACNLVKPDGWKVPDKKWWIDHGFTNAQNEAEGRPMPELLDEFLAAYEDADLLVFHNVSYDLPIINCEMYRYKRKIKKTLEKFCTKLQSEYICKIPGPYGKYKWPTLDEAYKFFYGTSFEGAHAAGNDVEACKKVYLAIRDYDELI